MRRGTVLVAVVALLGLTSCTDDASPSPPVSVTSVSPTTAAATTPPMAPTVPAAEPTAKSAEAFVRYFWAVYNFAYATLDPGPLTAISEGACELCTSATKDIERLAKKGVHIQGAEVRVTSTIAPPGKITQSVLVATVISQEAGVSTDRSGTIQDLKSIPERRSYVGLHWIASSWHVNGVTIEKSTQTS